MIPLSPLALAPPLVPAGPPEPTPGPGRPAGDRSGFTLLELMIVTVLLGILAMIALPVYQGIRASAAEGALTEQLRTLAQAQRMHFLEFDVYTDDPTDLDYRPAANLQLEIRVGSGGGAGGPPGGWPPGGGPPGGGPPGGGPPGGGPPGGGPPGGGPPGAGPPGGGSGPGDGWSARLTDAGYGVRCAVFYGSTDPYEPASVEGEIACDEEG